MKNNKILIDEEMLQLRIQELADKITDDFNGEEITLICILKGSMYFFADLSRKIKLDTNIEFMRVSSYKGENTTGNVDIKLNIDNPVTGKNVIIVEDIIDSGNTLSYLVKYFNKDNPKSIKICTLLDKPERREVDDVKVDYVGFIIPNRFVVGYGLDLDEKYRNIPTVNCITKNEEEEKQVDLDRNNLKLQLKRRQ